MYWKKGLFLIGLSVLIMGNSLFAFGKTGTGLSRQQAVTQTMEKLYQSENPSFRLEESYCVHENRFMHLVVDDVMQAEGYPLLCVRYLTVDGHPFTDVDGDVSVMLGYGMGLVQGYGNHTFLPEKPITYGEAVALLVQAFRIPSEVAPSFPEGYLKNAEAAGLVQESLKAEDTISQEAFSVLLNRFYIYAKEYTPYLGKDFRAPLSAKECVQTYAKACKERDGYTQYALLSGELREKSRAALDEMGWVTGVSSPWIEDYTIEAAGELAYTVSLHMKTSTGDAGIERQTLFLQQEDDAFYIRQIDKDGFK